LELLSYRFIIETIAMGMPVVRGNAINKKRRYREDASIVFVMIRDG